LDHGLSARSVGTFLRHLGRCRAAKHGQTIPLADIGILNLAEKRRRTTPSFISVLILLWLILLERLKLLP
jgi:hypothetical protein